MYKFVFTIHNIEYINNRNKKKKWRIGDSEGGEAKNRKRYKKDIIRYIKFKWLDWRVKLNIGKIDTIRRVIRIKINWTRRQACCDRKSNKVKHLIKRRINSNEIGSRG